MQSRNAYERTNVKPEENVLKHETYEGVRTYLYPGCDNKKRFYALEIIARNAKFVTSP